MREVRILSNFPFVQNLVRCWNSSELV
jgi:hypothetical protein